MESGKATALMYCVTKETCWVTVSALTELDTALCSIQSMKGLWSSSTLTHTQPEAIEGMSVDAIQLANESDGKLHHDPNLGLLPLSVLKDQIIQQPHYDSLKLCFDDKSKHVLMAF